MNMKLLTIAMAALVATGAAQAEMKNFKVNGQTITAAEQKAVYDGLVASGQPAGEALEQFVRNNLVANTVLLQEAKKAKVENDADFKKALDQYKEQLMVRFLQVKYAKDHPIKEADLKKAYDAAKAAYGDKEYNVAAILVSSEKAGQDLIDKLNKGADFADLAKKNSLDENSKAKGGDLGWHAPSQLGGTLGLAISQLAPGAVGQTPIRQGNAFLVIKNVKERPQQNFPTYAQLKPQLNETLLNQEINNYVVDLVKKAKIQ